MSYVDTINQGSSGGTAGSIDQLYSDPASPTAEQVWVLATLSGGQLSHSLLHIGLTTAVPTYTYQLSYRTIEGTTIRVTLS